MENNIKQIVKRNNNVVEFNPDKITQAIFKAMEAAGDPNIDLAKDLSERVAVRLNEQFVASGENPKVEHIQDIVEQILVEEGQAKVAKAYILYRQKRAEIRQQKQQLLQKQEIDEVDKRFDLNALKVLCSRYLKKDERGNIIESPSELFERVAIHSALPSLFFDRRIFQKTAGDPQPAENFDPAKLAGKPRIGRFVLNEFHLDGLNCLYNRFNQQGKMTVKFFDILKMIKEREFDSYEMEITQYFDLMAQRKFFPNTPALANFGNVLGMGSACFVIGVEDSIESIMSALAKSAIIFKSGGGVGYNFSKLRPAGDFVKSTGGVSSGPIVFMSLFDKMTDVIKQGGIRRGASMGILNIDHPDIEQFIIAKRGNNALRNFNISVLIKPDFWEYLEKKKPYPLSNPKNGAIIKYADPQNLLNLIVYQAWESGEPGLVFKDRINKYNPFLESLGPIECTNPCVVGDTLVAVADGRNYVPIRQLAQEGKDIPVYCYGDGKVRIRMGRNPRKTRVNVKVWKVTIDDGSQIIATEDHKFRSRDNKEVKLKDLAIGASLMPFYKFQYRTTGKRTDYWGIVLNNGKRAQAEHRLAAEFYLGRAIKKYPDEVVHHKNFNGLDNYLENLEIMRQSDHDRLHQIGERNVMRGKWWHNLSVVGKEAYRKKMSQAVSGENNGMYGRHHQRRTKLLLSQQRKNYFNIRENRERLSQIIYQLYREHPEIKAKISQAKTFYPMLAAHCLTCGQGINYKRYKPRVFCSRSCASVHNNQIRDTENVRKSKAIRREELRQGLRQLGLKFLEERQRFPTYKEFRDFASINGYTGDVRSTFGGFINFKEALSLHNHKVVAVEFYGYEDVYNITVDDFHTVAYITNPHAQSKFTNKPLLSGIITSQCGELPLYPSESCNLGSINVWAFCKSSPTNGRKKSVEFDWDGFRQTIMLATRFLDNVIDVNKYPLPEIEEMTLKTRKIGLGIMGLGDLLYEMEIPYNSSDGLGFMAKLMEFVNYYSKVASVDLAKERGKFPLYKESFYPDGKLPIEGPEDKKACNLDWDELKESIIRSGIRNSQTTTNAPTGSISMIAGASSGIEPVFSLVFEKEVAIGSFYYVDPVFERSMEREGLFDDPFIRQVSERGGTVQGLNYVPPRLKKVFITAMDIDAKDHIKALATLQNWTDSSISKTINFPSNATVDDMRKAYLLAYELGCKDITAFRDQSIKGVLNAGAKKDKEVKPKSDGEIEMISLKDEKAKGPSIYLEPGPSSLGAYNSEELCPKCKTPLIRAEGCKKCPECGWGVCAG